MAGFEVTGRERGNRVPRDETDDPNESKGCFPFFVAEFFSACVDVLYFYDRRQSLRGYDRSIHAYRSNFTVNVGAGCGPLLVAEYLFANIYQFKLFNA